MQYIHAWTADSIQAATEYKHLSSTAWRHHEVTELGILFKVPRSALRREALSYSKLSETTSDLLHLGHHQHHYHPPKYSLATYRIPLSSAHTDPAQASSCSPAVRNRDSASTLANYPFDSARQVNVRKSCLDDSGSADEGPSGRCCPLEAGTLRVALAVAGSIVAVWWGRLTS